MYALSNAGYRISARVARAGISAGRDDEGGGGAWPEGPPRTNADVGSAIVRSLD